MINKCNKMFSIFGRNVVLSKNTLINAITPYDIIFKSNVITIDDVVDNTRTYYVNLNNIPDNTLYSYCNPTTEEWWYIGKHLVAYQDKKKMNYAGISCPRIVLLFNDCKAIADENYSDFYFKFKKSMFREYFSKVSKSVMFISDIGVLCYPEKPVINNFECTEIKLPLVI